MNEVIQVICQAPQEPVLARLRREYMQALISENEALRDRLTATRIATVEAWGYDLEVTNPVVVAPIEVTTPSFDAKREKAEALAGSSFRKFFAR